MQLRLPRGETQENQLHSVFTVVKLAFDGWSLRLCSVPVRPCSLGEPRFP